MYTWERCAEGPCARVPVYATGVHELMYMALVYTDWWCTRLQGTHNLSCALDVGKKEKNNNGVQILKYTCRFNNVHTDLYVCTPSGCTQSPQCTSSTQLPYQELSVNLHKVCGSRPVLSGRPTSPCAVPRPASSHRAKKTGNALTCTLSILLQIQS